MLCPCDKDLDYIDSDITTFGGDDMDNNTIGLNNNSVDDNDDDLETMIHAILVAWWDEYKQKLSKEVMLIA